MKRIMLGALAALAMGTAALAEEMKDRKSVV